MGTLAGAPRPGLLMVLAASFALGGCSHEQPFARTSRAIPDGVLRERLILIGDAGSVDAGAPVLRSVREWSDEAPSMTTVVYLGDNVYPAGVYEGAPPEKEAILTRQIDAAGRARVLFVPGNHDWARGREAVAYQSAFVSERGAAFLPEPGCPGPASHSGARRFMVIALDTQWFLEDDPPLCGAEDRDAAWTSASDRIGALLATAGGRPVVVAAHHPPATHGSHGGFFDWRDYLFPFSRLYEWLYLPFPVLYPLASRLCVNDQDLCSPNYEAMNHFLRRSFSAHEGAGPLIFAGGHDHSLQVLKDREPFDYVVVSGSGSKLSAVTDGDETLFAHLQRGFVVLDAIEGQGIALRIVEPGRGEIQAIRLSRRSSAVD